MLRSIYNLNDLDLYGQQFDAPVLNGSPLTFTWIFTTVFDAHSPLQNRTQVHARPSLPTTRSIYNQSYGNENQVQHAVPAKLCFCNLENMITVFIALNLATIKSRTLPKRAETLEDLDCALNTGSATHLTSLPQTKIS